MKRKKKSTIFRKPTFKEKINNKLRRKELDMDDVLWLFAIRDGRQQIHFDTYYGRYEENTNVNTFVGITRDILDKVDGWSTAIKLVKMDQCMITMLRHNRGVTEPLSLNEWLWEAIKRFSSHWTVNWFDRHAPKGWRKKVNKEREDFIRDDNGKWWSLRENIYAECLYTDKHYLMEEYETYKVVTQTNFHHHSFIEVNGKYGIKLYFPKHMLKFFIKETKNNE